MKRNLIIKLFAPALMVASSGFLSSCSSVLMMVVMYHHLHNTRRYLGNGLSTLLLRPMRWKTKR